MSDNTIATKSFDFGQSRQQIEVTISTAPVNYINAVLLSQPETKQILTNVPPIKFNLSGLKPGRKLLKSSLKSK